MHLAGSFYGGFYVEPSDLRWATANVLSKVVHSVQSED